MPTTKQKAKSKTLAAPLGRRPGCQGGAQRGGRGGTRREQYLDSPAFDHTLAARVLFLAAVPTFGYDSKQKLSLTDCPFFRSKPIKITMRIRKKGAPPLPNPLL